MGDHNTRIVISADAKGVADTTTQLEKLGKVDKNNAEQFKKHHEQAKKQHGEQIDFNTKLTHSFAELGEGIVAAFALERILEWGGEAIKAFEEAEKATNELKFAVKNLAGGTDSAFTELQEQSEKLSQSLNTLFTPKQIQQSQSLLLRMKLNTEQVAELMPRIADIAAKTGKDINSVAEGFGRAISEGNTKALTEFGLKFKDTGTIVGNFNHVMESSAKYVGGAAEAMDDAANKTKEQNNQLELQMEMIGSKLSPAWIGLKEIAIGAITSMIHGFESLYDSETDALNELEKYGISLDAAKKLMGAGLSTSTAQWTKENKKVIESLTDLMDVFDQYKRAIVENNVGTEGISKLMLGVSKDVKKLDLATEEGQVKLKLYLQFVKELQVLQNKKGDEEGGLVNLKKLTDKQLEIRLEGAKEEDAAIGKFTTAGFAKEAQRIEKEIALRKKGGEEAKKLREKQHKEEIDQWKTAESEALKIINQMIADERDRIKNEEEISKLVVKKAEQTNESVLEGQKLALKKKFDAKQITEAEYEKQTKDLENASRVEDDKLELDNIKEQNQIKREQLKRERDMNLITEEDYRKQLLQLDVEQSDAEIKLQKDINKSVFDLKADQANKTKELITSIMEITTTIMESVQESIESSINAIDTQMERQNKMIDYQKVLAEKGLNNDLAFEERRADELSKKKLEEQKKLRKAKELETFLNSLATFAEQNPNTAIAKALGVLAASKAVEAIYMEEGGIMGQTSQRSAIGLNHFARRHRSGNDLLIHGERGEGVIPVNKMKEWGLTNNGMFSNFLRNPFTAIPIPQSQPMFVNNNADLLAEIKELKEAVKNKPDFFMNVNELNEWVTKEVRNGVATFTTHKRKGI